MAARAEASDIVAADPTLAEHPCWPRRWPRSSPTSGRVPGQGMTRIVAGAAKGRRLAVPRAGHPADLGPGPRGAVQLARAACGPRRRRGCWTCSPAPARSGSRRSRAAPRAVSSSSRDRAACDVLRRNVAAVGLPGRRGRRDARSRAVLAGAPDEPYDVVFADPPYAAVRRRARRPCSRLLAAAVAGRRSARGRGTLGARRRAGWPDGVDTGQRTGATARARFGTVAPTMRTPPPAAHRRRPGPRGAPAICPGSFDPVTNGHLDIIGRAAQLYDEVVVAVFVNQSKSSLFTRRRAPRHAGRGRPPQYGNVRIDSFHGLVVDYCRAHDIPVIVKGLRAVSDFDYELQMAQMNRGLAGVDTLFMPTNPEYSFLASSLVKEIAKWGGDVSALVPPDVLKRLQDAARGQRTRRQADDRPTLARADELLPSWSSWSRPPARCRCPRPASCRASGCSDLLDELREVLPAGDGRGPQRGRPAASELLQDAYDKAAAARERAVAEADTVLADAGHQAEQSPRRPSRGGRDRSRPRPGRARPAGRVDQRAPGRREGRGRAARGRRALRARHHRAGRHPTTPRCRAEADRYNHDARAEAERYATKLTADAEDYAERTLDELSAVLHRAAQTAEQGRAALAQRRAGAWAAQPAEDAADFGLTGPLG